MVTTTNCNFGRIDKISGMNMKEDLSLRVRPRKKLLCGHQVLIVIFMIYNEIS